MTATGKNLNSTLLLWKVTVTRFTFRTGTLTRKRQVWTSACRIQELYEKLMKVHIFYSSKSQGTHFDMGVAFGLRKKIVIVENEPFGEGKSYPRMLTEWEKVTSKL